MTKNNKINNVPASNNDLSKFIINDESVDECSSSNESIESRPKWGNRFEFLLACVGYSVGLGNVW